MAKAGIFTNTCASTESLEELEKNTGMIMPASMEGMESSSVFAGESVIGMRTETFYMCVIRGTNTREMGCMWSSSAIGHRDIVIKVLHYVATIVHQHLDDKATFMTR